MSDSALVIMARYPEAGKTKTRLARWLGNDETARLYRAFLTDLALRFATPENDLHWAYTPAEVNYAAFVTTLAPEQTRYMHCFPQQGRDLGARLLHAFQRTHQCGYARTVIISSDAPHVSRELVVQAHAALAEADVVLGPSADGGYYLIAMRQPHDVFSGIPMSTSVVLQQTIELARSQGLLVRLLETLFDIDELPDLLRLSQLLAADSSLAPITAAHLALLKKEIENDHDTCYHPSTFDLHRADQPL